VLKPSRLLIFDDDAGVARTLQMIAETAGLEVRSCQDPACFFTELAAWRPTHIALDLIMPGMDGVEVIGELAARECDAQLILTSGVAGRILEAAERTAVEHGLRILGVLSKPFSTERFRSLLRSESDPGQARVARPARPRPASNGTRAEISPQELWLALEQHDLRVVYQPKVRCATGELRGFEALARWTHPYLGPIPPVDFIPIAEQHGLIDRLTDSVLATALAWLAPLVTKSPLSVAINLSTRSTSVGSRAPTPGSQSGSAFVDRVTGLCSHFGVQPARLTFELTESNAMEDPVASLDLLTRLRMKGFQLSIDDFGTGYSSMVQLVRLPFSEVKIDRSFVNSALTSPESRAVVESIVLLGRSLEMTTVAEGVEDRQTLDFLVDIGCDLAQGYFIGRPMDDAAAVDWLAEYAAAHGTG
jgi:EAL domain-containing protein (putative c-di-GMP-specific phosphodiesterase class I)/FixJ family two-component response regulator